MRLNVAQKLIEAHLVELPLEFADPGDYDDIHQGDQLIIENARDVLAGLTQITIRNASTGWACQAATGSPRVRSRSSWRAG